MSSVSLHAAAAGIVDAGRASSTSAMQVDEVAALADGLDALAGSLHVAAHACGQAVRDALPVPSSPNSICDRYREARERWPTSASPSNERLAALLSSVDDAVAAMRAAAEACVHARDAVEVARDTGGSCRR